MRRNTLLLFFCLLFSILFVLPVGAVPMVDNTVSVHDLADLLTEEEEVALQQKVAVFQDTFAMDMVVVTTADAEGLAAMEYADDFFDYNHFGFVQGAESKRPDYTDPNQPKLPKEQEPNGVLLLLDMDNREFYVSTAGMAIRVYDDADIEQILDAAFRYLPDGEYYKTIDSALQECSAIAKKRYQQAAETPKGKQEIRDYVQEDYDYTKLDLSWQERFEQSFQMALPIAVVVSVLVVVVLLIMHKRSLAPPPPVSQYLENGRPNVLERQDIFVNTYTSRRRLPDDSDSSSGSSGGGGFSSGGSSHSSSSGSSHGGGGRSF